MKSQKKSFWLLTTCLGNIIDIFLVELKLHPTQSGEYFILSAIMAGSTTVFILLSIFYYEYVDPAIFESNDDDSENSDDEKASMKKSKRSSISSKSSAACSMHKSTGLSNSAFEQVKDSEEYECEF